MQNNIANLVHGVLDVAEWNVHWTASQKSCFENSFHLVVDFVLEVTHSFAVASFVGATPDPRRRHHWGIFGAVVVVVVISVSLAISSPSPSVVSSIWISVIVFASSSSISLLLSTSR